jgi:hypothetical protein
VPATGSLIVWASDASAGDPPQGTSLVLLLRACNAGELRECAQRVAAEAGLARVRAWDDAEGSAEKKGSGSGRGRRQGRASCPCWPAPPSLPPLMQTPWLAAGGDRGCWF